MDHQINIITAMLASTPDRWNSFAQTLPGEFLNRRPAEQEWSATECLQHLIDVERIFQFRLDCFLSGTDFPAFDPDKEGSDAKYRSIVELATEFEQLRISSLQSIRGLQASDFNRKVMHAELGPVKLLELLNEWAAHDLNHTIQAERAMMQPFILECGPWQQYFKEFLIGDENSHTGTF